MTKYWIVVNNAHDGPFTAEQLAEMKLSGDTFAWYPGLPKWTKIKDMPELAALVAEEREEEVAPAQAVADSENAVDAKPAANGHAVPPAPPARTMPPAPPARPTFSRPAYNAYAPAGAVQDACEKCPPSYLAWSIVTTILFFLPLGIVAIIYSTRVATLWNAGERERARRASETAAWFSNISFTVGLIWMPFSMVLAMMF